MYFDIKTDDNFKTAQFVITCAGVEATLIPDKMDIEIDDDFISIGDIFYIEIHKDRIIIQSKGTGKGSGGLSKMSYSITTDEFNSIYEKINRYVNL